MEARKTTDFDVFGPLDTDIEMPADDPASREEITMAPFDLGPFDPLNSRSFVASESKFVGEASGVCPSCSEKLEGEPVEVDAHYFLNQPN